MIIIYKALKEIKSAMDCKFCLFLNYFPADPYFTLVNEKKQFDGKYAISSNLFKFFFMIQMIIKNFLLIIKQNSI